MLSLETRVRDCLYLTWAFPLAAEPGRPAPPALPAPLRLDTRRASPAGAPAPAPGEPLWYVSVVLFRQEGLHLRHMPLVRLSYPQMNLRTYVLDEDGTPSVFFLGQWVPAWLAPLARLAGGGVVAAARFAVPAAPVLLADTPQSWQVRDGASFLARAWRGALAGAAPSPPSAPVSSSPPAPAGAGPMGPARCGFAHHAQAVAFLRDRRRGYSPGLTGRSLRRIDVEPRAGQEVPVAAEVVDPSLVAATLGVETAALGPPAHAFLCSELLFRIALVTLPQAELASGAEPSPA